VSDLCSDDLGAFPKLRKVLEQIWPGKSVRIEPTTILGQMGSAGQSGHGLSSAAFLRVEGVADSRRCFPWPESPVGAGGGVAPVFLLSGRQYVFPTIRLWVSRGREGDWHFLSLDDWLEAAFITWEYPESGDTASKPKSLDTRPPSNVRGPHVLDRLAARDDFEKLSVVGNVIKYAIMGQKKGRQGRRHAIWRETELRLPFRDSCLQQVVAAQDGPATDFRLRAARTLVITAEVGFGGAKSREKGAGVPKRTSKAKQRLKPSKKSMRGVDPFHTEEDERIRLHLHLGDGVYPKDGKLRGAGSGKPALSPSTIRIPFAGYNDPRRLLLGAKM
jgi:hypothetical protein